MQGLALILMVARALARCHDVEAVITQNALQLRDVGEARHIIENQGLVSQQTGNHQRQGRILRAGNRNRAIELVAADNANAIHAKPALLRLSAFSAFRGEWKPRSRDARIPEPSP